MAFLKLLLRCSQCWNQRVLNNHLVWTVRAYALRGRSTHSCRNREPNSGTVSTYLAATGWMEVGKHDDCSGRLKLTLFLTCFSMEQVDWKQLCFRGFRFSVLLRFFNWTGQKLKRRLANALLIRHSWPSWHAGARIAISIQKAIYAGFVCPHDWL